MPKAKPPMLRSVGRPRTRPSGAVKRSWYATEEEFARLREEAKREGISAEELVRRRVLAQ